MVLHGSRRTHLYLCAEKLYRNVDSVDERHRHRYEVNPMYIEDFEEAGMRFVGRSDDNKRMEILELDSNDLSSPTNDHPFVSC